MAVAAPMEVLSTERMAPPPIDCIDGPESYWQSLRQIKIVGNFAIRQELQTERAVAAREEALLDFAMGAQENLATDEEYGEQLGFEPMREMEIQGGHVVNKNGEPVVGLVKRGWQQSRRLAEVDERYEVQATRDEGDFMVATIVDGLEVGEMYAVASMDPKEAMARDGKEFWESKMHYREGMAVVQVYYRKDEHTMLAGAYSVKRSDKAAFARILGGHGTVIDPSTHSDYWSRYGVRKTIGLEEARAFGVGVRNAHRQEIGETSAVISVTELMKTHEHVVNTYFDTYIVPLAEASVRGRNNATMQNLAKALLGQSSVFKQSVVDQLTKVSSSAEFDDADTRFMEEMVRYALVEHLRTYLSKPVGNVPAQNQPDVLYGSARLDVLLATYVSGGTAAGRSYGGCSSAGNLGKNEEDVLGGIFKGPQDIYGGKAGDEDSSGAEDKYGSLSFKCPKGHPNTRPRNQLIDRCRACGTSVKC